jgi:hypothetical protein
MIIILTIPQTQSIVYTLSNSIGILNEDDFFRIKKSPDLFSNDGSENSISNVFDSIPVGLPEDTAFDDKDLNTTSFDKASPFLGLNSIPSFVESN